MAFYTDNFNRANENPVAGSWIVAKGYTRFCVSSNRALGTVSSANSMAIYNQSLSANQYSQVVCTGGQDTAGYYCQQVWVRVGDSTTYVNGYTIGSETAYEVGLYRVTNGVLTELASYAYNIQATDVIKITAIGSSIKGYINGVERLSATDATYSTGTVAFSLYGNNASYSIADDWECGDTAAAVSVADTLALSETITKTGTTMPSLAYVQSRGASEAGGSGTIALAPSGAFLSGSLVVVLVSCVDSTGSTTATCADSVPQTYTLGVGPTRHATLGTSGFAQWIFYFPCSAAGANTVTVTFSTSVAGRRIDIVEYKGIAYTSLVDGTPVGATGTTGIPSSGNTTTSNAADLIFGGGLNDGGDMTADAGSGFTQRVRADGYDCAEDKIVAATGNYAATFGTGTVDWIAQVIAFKSGTASPITFSVADSLSVADGTFTLKPGNLKQSVYDALALAEQAPTVTISAPLNVQIVFNETLIVSEMVVFAGGAAPVMFTDALGVSESVEVWRSERVVENADALDFAEVLTIIREGIGKVATEDLLLAEGVTVNLTNITISVDVGTLDFSEDVNSMRPELTYEFIESAILSESAGTSYGACVISCVEALGLSDDVSYTPSGSVFVSVMETASFTDAMDRATTRQVNTLYFFTALTGGTAGTLDNLDGNSLSDGDRAWVVTATTSYWYYLDEDSGVTESSPSIIAPNTNAGAKRWRRCT